MILVQKFTVEISLPVTEDDISLEDFNDWLEDAIADGMRFDEDAFYPLISTLSKEVRESTEEEKEYFEFEDDDIN